jgi:sigma-B regulation protein RsbU (phosphoserine phosphatase)
MALERKVTVRVAGDVPAICDQVAETLEAAGFPVVRTDAASGVSEERIADVSAEVFGDSETGDTAVREEDVARLIQRELLTEKPPKYFTGVTVAAGTIPSDRVDGDFFDFFQFGDRCLDVMIGDVMGKGIPSALMGAALKTLFLRVIQELENSEIHPVSPPHPVHIVSRVQAAVINRLKQSGTFATICYGRFDIGRRLFRYVDCSHTRTVHYQRASEKLQLLSGINMPIGFPEMKPFVERQVSFSEGDIFFFYSDGLTEARNQEGEVFGENRLLKSLRSHIQREPDALIRDVWDDVMRFSGSHLIHNDFTSVAVRIETVAKDGPVRESELEIPCDIRWTSDVRRFIRDFGMCGPGAEIWKDRLDMLVLAATEVVTNIIRHACARHPDVRIRILARKTPDTIEVSFFDRGDSFDPGGVPPPRFDGSREGGFGLYIISHAVDEYTYTHDSEGNNCTRLLVSMR